MQAAVERRGRVGAQARRLWSGGPCGLALCFAYAENVAGSMRRRVLSILSPISSPSTAAAVRQALLAQRDAITNWEAFSQANSIVGWSESEPNVCKWSGVNCTADGTVYRL